MEVETSLQKLFSLHTFGIKLGLENTINFLDHLGNPQKQLKAIHVAGSNGKGSTSSFIASILQEAGFKTGLYTSPHFVKFNERIVINGKQIDDEYIAEFISDNQKYIDEHQLTFFEVTTAMAFKYFLENETDVCVIETGLGGRLDATNVLNPLAVVITTISLEHTNVLGNTIKEIAFEKSAIIKSGANVFTGIMKNEATEVIRKKCKEPGNLLFQLENFILDTEQDLKLIADQERSIQINPPLRGEYQRLNAALASLTLLKSFPELKFEYYQRGIENVSINTGLQGRFEFFHRSPDIILDSAHNPEGVENFLSEFSKSAGSYKKRNVLFGAMRDKAIGEMLMMLSQQFDEIYTSRIQYERAATLDEISAECNRLNIDYKLIDDPAKFVGDFKSSPKNECLVVLGSMYLLGEIKQSLIGSIA